MVVSAGVIPDSALNDPMSVRASGVSRSKLSVGWAGHSWAVQYKLFKDGAFLSNTSDTTSLVTASGASAVRVVGIEASGISRLLGTVSSSPLAAPLVIEETFEQLRSGETLMPGWYVALPGKVTVSTEKARTGTKSLKCDFDIADVPTETHCSINGNSLFVSELNKSVWFGLSTFLGEDYTPDDPNNGEIIWQWHGVAGGPAAHSSPPLAHYIHGNTATIKVNIGDEPDTYGYTLASWTMTDDVGVWIDWVGRVKFAYVDGEVEIWKKRSTDTEWGQIVDYSGSTIYHSEGQTNENGCYLLVGPYKWYWLQNYTVVSHRTMYADEIHVGDETATFNDVAPGQ